MVQSEKQTALEEIVDAEQVEAKHSRDSDTRPRSAWWIKLVVQPLILLACGAILLAGLGVAQRLGWISAGGGGHDQAASAEDDTQYICPMMCTPPQDQPGRCPVCGMELVPTTSGGGNTDPRAVIIDPVARRVANIQTVAVQNVSLTRTIRAVGQLGYNEATLKTISAYVDGRLERLYADYTGVVVSRGDKLALVYSPKLYSSQAEFLLAKKARAGGQTSTLARVRQSNDELYESARQRLIELGMTSSQIEQLEQSNEADSRLHLLAPTGGTVIEKSAVEGEYVKEGDVIYRLADLSTVWLMLELFPEDAALVRVGGQVQAQVQSLPGRSFTGRVEFIDPQVNPQTRTVGVRVAIENEDGALMIGDYAKAKIEVALGETTDPSAEQRALVIPRSALLSAGENSVVYVENQTQPGRFEIRPVTLGSRSGEQVVVLEGLQPGERVATRGNFLIDSQMQLAGKPSLIDPTKAQPNLKQATSPRMIAALEQLSEEEQQLAKQQRICPVTELPLGSMGTPPKVQVEGETLLLCCEACRQSVQADPEKYQAKLLDANPHGVPEVKIIEEDSSSVENDR